MKNTEYLKENINQLEMFIADTEQQISTGEWWLDAQLGSLKYHLNDLRRQLVEAIAKREEDNNCDGDNRGWHTKAVPEWVRGEHNHRQMERTH